MIEKIKGWAHGVRLLPAAALDLLLGPRCECGQRVFPNDEKMHRRIHHAGDDR